MNLTEMSYLTDLDLSHNLFSGFLPSNCFPQSIKRLDLNNNHFDDVNGLIIYKSLLNLNISHNKLKIMTILPCNIQYLDMSYNLISSAIHLRLLSFSPSIKKLFIIGNPIVSTSSLCKTIIVSVLPNVEQIDDIILPRKNKNKLLSNKKDNNQNNNEQKKNNIIIRKIQVKADEMRSLEYAKKIKKIDTNRKNVDKEILLLARPMTIGLQETELLVRRLTWVPPQKGVGAEFFYPSTDTQYYTENPMIYSSSNDKGDDGKQNNRNDDYIYKCFSVDGMNNNNSNTNTNNKDMNESKDKDKNNDNDSCVNTLDSESVRSYLSLPCKRRSSIQKKNDKNTNTNINFVNDNNPQSRSASANKWRSLLNNKNPRYDINNRNNIINNSNSNTKNKNNNNNSNNLQSSSLSSSEKFITKNDCNVSGGSHSKAFSSFGPTRNVVLTRTNSAPHLVQNSTNLVPSSSSVGKSTYKAFSRHTDIPLSPSRDRKAAGIYRRS